MTNETLPAALAAILVRHSIGPKHLREPAPDDPARELAALRAPGHGKLVPFRFAVIRGAARERLADLFEDDGRRRGKSRSVLGARAPAPDR